MINKGKSMFDKISPEAAQGLLVAFTSFALSILGSLNNGGKRNWKADVVEALTCSLFSLAGLSFVIAMEWNLHVSMVFCVFIASMGSKKIKQLAEDMVNKYLKK